MEFKSKQDMRDVFEAFCSKYLCFLSEDFAFRIISVEKDNYGCFITYQNNNVALKASLCPLDGRISFDFYRLVNGEIPKYPFFFDARAEFLAFNFDNLILLKNGKILEQKQDDLFNAEGIERIIKEYTLLLKRYASNLFRGDFSVLPQIKEIVARRAKELEHEQ